MITITLYNPKECFGFFKQFLRKHQVKVRLLRYKKRFHNWWYGIKLEIPKIPQRRKFCLTTQFVFPAEYTGVFNAKERTW